MTNHAQAEPGVVSKLSPRTVAGTVERLTGMIAAKGMTLFGVIDQRAAAATAGLQLRATTLVLFGSPAAGTPVMAAAPLSALDLPLKVLVWAGNDGSVWVSYNTAEYLAARHHLAAAVQVPLEAVGPLTDAVVGEQGEM
jgi:uncharacterized protein (DUF302 family)